MHRREEFLAAAIEAHRNYEAATTAIREMISAGQTSGVAWDAVKRRQAAALEEWSSLPRKFADFQEEDDSG